MAGEVQTRGGADKGAVNGPIARWCVAKRLLLMVLFVYLAACPAPSQTFYQSGSGAPNRPIPEIPAPDAPKLQGARVQSNQAHAETRQVMPTARPDKLGFLKESRRALESISVDRNAGERVRLDGVALDRTREEDHTRQQLEAVRRLYYPPRYHQPASSPSLPSGGLSRATRAAMRAILVRDSGKNRLNTAYLLRTMTSAAADTASTPYWRRSLANPFSDFGSMVGNDAGMNLWHEFSPGIGQALKSHTPRVFSRMLSAMVGSAPRR